MITLNVEEWLEKQYAEGGASADFASEILNDWMPCDEIEETEEYIEARKAADDAEEKLAVLEKAIQDHSLASEFVTTGHADTPGELTKFLDFAQEQSDQLDAIRVVLIDGGVLDPRDLSSNLAAIIAMFVPPCP